MIRAFAIAVVVSVLSACGEEPEPPPLVPPSLDVPSMYYAHWAGEWIGEVRGQTDKGTHLSFQISAQLEVSEEEIRLTLPCKPQGPLRSYFVGKDRVFMKTDKEITCDIPTPCGIQAVRLSSASLSTYGDDEVLAFVMMSGEVCGEEFQILHLSADMSRPR